MTAGTEILTVGHSDRSIQEFLTLLRDNGVTALADIRSAPYSAFQPQFNKQVLADALAGVGIAYSFLGRELGGRPEDASCYEHGRVQYAKVAATALFRSGLERVLFGANRYRIALMCAERDPLDCHRALMVAPELEKAGRPVIHIVEGSTETHAECMRRLLDLHKMPEFDLFRAPAEMIEEACYRQQQRVAFARTPVESPARDPLGEVIAG